MPEYGTQVAPRDRWCIAAYIRALQLSQNATSAMFPPDKKFRQLHRSSAISATEPRFRRLRFRPPQPQKGSLNDHGHRQDDEVGPDGSARRADHSAEVACHWSNRRHCVGRRRFSRSRQLLFRVPDRFHVLAGPLARMHGHSYDVSPGRGAWGTVIRRILESGMMTLPLMFVLFIPYC